MYTTSLFKKPVEWNGVMTLLTAADDNKFVVSVDMKNAAYTIAAQPSCPSRVGVGITATSTADTMGIITVVGTDQADNVISEIITPVAGATTWGSKYFKTLTSITGSGWTAVAGADKIIVGTSADSLIHVHGRGIRFKAVSGNIWVNPKQTAVADVTSYLMVGAETLEITVSDDLSVISDGSGATFSYMIMED
jgi:hypothetical protein